MIGVFVVKSDHLLINEGSSTTRSLGVISYTALSNERSFRCSALQAPFLSQVVTSDPFSQIFP